MRLKWYHIVFFTGLLLAIALLSVPSSREHALNLVRSGEFEKAIPLLQKAIKENPDDETAIRDLVQVYIQTNEPGGDGEPLRKATDLINAFLTRNPQKKQSFEDQLLELYLWQNNLDGATAVLKDKLERTPGDAKIRNRLVDLMLSNRDVEGAIEVLVKLAKPSPTDRMRLAELYEQVGRLDDAIAIWRSMLKGTKEDLVAIAYNEQDLGSPLGNVRKVARWRGDAALETEALQKMLAIDESLETWRMLFDLSVWKGNMDNAAASADAIEDYEGVDAQTLRQIRTLRMHQRDGKRSVRVAARLLTHPDVEPQDFTMAAQLYAWTGQPQKGVETIRLALEKYPKNVDVLSDALRLSLEMREADLRAEWAVRLANLRGIETDFQTAAQALADAGRLDEARKMIEPWADPKKNSSQSVWLAGSLALQAEDREEARRRADQLAAILKKNEDDLDTGLLAADLYGRLALPAEEAVVREVVARIEPNDAALQEQLARAYNDSLQLKKARAVLDKLEGMPGADMIFVRRERARNMVETVLRMSADDPNLAEFRANAAKAVMAALEDQPDDTLSLSLARLLMAEGKMDEAAVILAGIPTTPADLWIDAAAGYAAQGRNREAYASIDKLGPKPILTAIQKGALASVYSQLGENKRALDLYKQAHKEAPADDVITVALADTHGLLKEYDEQYALMEPRARRMGTERAWLDAADRHLWAIDRVGEARVLAEAMTKVPASTLVIARRVEALTAIGEYAQARDLYLALKEAGKGNNPRIMKVVADGLFEMGESREARTLYLEALQIEPGNSDVLLALGKLLREMEEYVQAEVAYRRYLALRPNDGQSWFELGEIIFDGGGDGEAAMLQAVKLVPLERTEYSLWMHARMQERFGNLGAAIELYTQVIALGTREADIACDFVDVLLRAEDIDKAEAVTNYIAQFHPRHLRVRRRIAVIKIQRGFYRDAIEVLEELRKDWPEDVGTQADLAYAYEVAGYWWRSMDNYDRASRHKQGKRR